MITNLRLNDGSIWESKCQPTFRSKISDFIIFPAIDFQLSADLLNFYAGGKSNYMVYLETKPISSNFHQIP